MAADSMTYSTKDDLRIGDIRLPERMGDGSSFVEAAADYIDANIGHIYVTPIEIDADDPALRPQLLMLKNINNLIASGRLILDLAASSESQELHAYGRSMLKEGLELLKMIMEKKIVLTGATDIDTDGDGEKSPTAPLIFNEDPESLVQGFYSPGVYVAGLGEPYPVAGYGFPRPYGGI